MRISSISESHWSDILNLQSEAYYDVESESLDVLKAKWLQSHEHCFICQDGQQMLGYLLAHSWNSEEPPALYDVLPGKSEGSILFLHDLRSEEHTSELQSRPHLVCRLLLEKKKTTI